MTAGPLFPRPSLPELDARIARTLVELQRSNGEAYTELLGTVAYLRAMRAQVEREGAQPARCGECNGRGTLTVLGGDWGKTPDREVPCWACKGRTLPPEPTGSKGY